MKISSIEAYPVSAPPRPGLAIVDAYGKHPTFNFVLVVVRTDDGTVGFGEANGTPTWSGETQEGALALIRQILAPVCLGKDPRNVTALADAMDRTVFGNPFTKASLEMALVDLAGKILRVPAHFMLGGQRRPSEIPLKFSIGAFPPSIAANVAMQMAAQGFRAVKVKVGLGVDADIARVKAVRSALGENFSVAVDANGGWTESEALAALPHLEACRINAIEQPLHRRDFRGCARLRARTSIPIMLDDAIFTPEDALEAIRCEACDLISIYPGKNGGLWRSLQVAQIAAAAGIECVIGSNLEREVGSAAMLHLAVSIPNLSRSVGHDIIGPLYYEHQLGTQPTRIENGCAILPDGNGLGVEVDLRSLQNGAIESA
jgi:muconate cycloisomerase